MSTPSIRDLVSLELRHAPRRGAVSVALLGALVIALTHLVLPLLPERAIALMRVGFRLEDLGGVLVVNDLIAVYFAAYFVGLAGSLGVVLMAREEHRLEILLAKPVRAGDLIVARSLPALLSSLFVGVVIAVAVAVAVAVHPDIGGSVTPAGALGGGLGLTGLALVLVAALQLAFVRMRDPFLALLVAALAWFVTVVPAAVLLYRPDLFDGRDVLADVIVLASWVWNDATSVWLGPLVVVVAVPLAWLLVRAAGDLMARSDAL